MNQLQSVVTTQALGIATPTEEIQSSTEFRGEDVGVKPASEVHHHIGHTTRGNQVNATIAD